MTSAAPAAPSSSASASTSNAGGKKALFFYGYYLVAVALVAQFVSAGTQTYVTGVFLKPMTEDLEWTRSEFGWAQSVSRFAMALIGFFVGAHVDKGRARGMMVIGCTILGSGLMLTSTIHDIGWFTAYYQWILLRGMFFTVGAALLSNLVVNVTLAKWWVEKRGRMVGISSMGVSLGGVLLPTPMTWIVDEFGWRTGWQVLAIMAWVLIYPMAMLMRADPERYDLHPDGRTDEDMRSARGANVRADFENSLTRGQALRTPALYVIIFAFGLSGVGLGTMIQQSIPFMTDAGIGRTTAAFLFSTFQSAPAAFSKPLWGFFLDKVSPKVLAAASFLVAAVGMPVVITGGATGSIPVLAVGLFLVGTGLGGQIPIQETIWASYFGRRYLGQVRSVAMPFSLLLGALGPQAVAIYFDRVGNYNGAFVGLGVLWSAAAVMVLLIRRPHNRGEATTRVPAAASGPAPRSAAAAVLASLPGPSDSASNGSRGRAPLGATSWSAWVTPQGVGAGTNDANGTNGASRRAASSLGFARPSNGVQRAVPVGDEEPAIAGPVAPRNARRWRMGGAYGLGAEGAEGAEPPPPSATETRNYMGYRGRGVTGLDAPPDDQSGPTRR
ncbi:MAG: MFS transporter [Dehalococcoidia bacterium]|nr:MFS transporter [Dehalococcoidia bacterium]